jgi:hypothetical protein
MTDTFGILPLLNHKQDFGPSSLHDIVATKRESGERLDKIPKANKEI